MGPEVNTLITMAWKNNYNWDNLDDCPLYGLLLYLLTDAVLMQKMLTSDAFLDS